VFRSGALAPCKDARTRDPTVAEFTLPRENAALLQ